MFNKRYRLIQRVAKLEKLMLERSVGRGGQSIAMNIWSFLMDHGPATKEEIDSALGSRYSNTTALNSWVKPGLIVKQGNQYVANPNYVWDDVGVINRSSAGPSAAEIAAAMQAANNGDFGDEQPSTRSRGRATRAPREPRPARAVTPNLFSRKYDEVKAAIDAGQDCTAANEKGITPLMFACKDPKGQSGNIVEMLLEHGANANDNDGNKRVIFNAIKNKNYEAVKSLVNHGTDLKVIYRRQYPFQFAANECRKIDSSNFDAFKSLVSQLFNNREFAFEFILNLLNEGIINNEQYDELIRKIYDSPRSTIDVYGGDMISSELLSNKNPTTSLDLFVNRNHKLSSGISEYALRRACERSSAIFDKLYSLYKDAADGKIGTGLLTQFLRNAKIVFDAKGEDTSELYEIIKPDLIRELSKSDNGRRDITNLILNSMRNGDTALLKKIADTKLTNLDGDEIVSNIAFGTGINNAAVPLALRIAGRCSDIKRSLYEYTMDRIVRSKNKYLIDWVIDRGYGQQLEDYINTRNYNISYMSQEFRDAFEKAGFALSGKRDTAGDRVAYNKAANTIIKAISSDVWNRSCNDLIAKYPQLLEDDDVIDAIKENPDSITGRQLQRRIDAIEKEPLKYDF
jgi:hypothetical protein